MEKEFIKEIVCNVLANECSKAIVDNVLNEFIPNYEQLNLDYTSPPNDETYVFKSEEEMIQLFIDNEEWAQTFYWNKYQNNPDRIMLGATITSDKHLIISLTFDGTHELKEKYYKKLKTFLNSDIGVISYVNPADYENGADFISKYSKVQYEFEDQ